MRIDTKSIEKILIFRRRKLGDVVLDTPLIRHLKQSLSWIEICYLTDRRYSEVLQGNPHITRVIPFSTLTPQLLHTIRTLKCDAVIDMMGNFLSLWVMLASGARYRIAHRKKLRMYNVEVPYSGVPPYTVYHRLDLLSPFGIDPSAASIELEVPVDETAKRRIETWFNKVNIAAEDLVISFQVETDARVRSWQAQNFAILADRLKEEAGAKIVLIQPPGQSAMLRRVVQFAHHEHHVLPSLSLKDLCAFMGMVDLHFGPDSGPRHLAIAHGVPTFSLFTTANPLNWTPPNPLHRWFTRGLACQPCETRNPESCPKGDFRCLEMSPDEVFDGMIAHMSSLGLLKGQVCGSD